MFGLRKFKPTSTTNAVSGAAKRRAECISLGPGLKHPSLRWRSLLQSGREETCRGASCGIVFNQASEPSTMTYCCCCCVYSRTIRSHERRALGALLFVVSRSESPLPPTVSCLAAERRGDCVRSRIAVVFVIQRIDRCSYCCVYLGLLQYQALPS